MFMNDERTKKFPIKNLISEFFMQSPIPMSISKAKDGTYVFVNDAALKFMGLKRKDVIGRKSSDLGHYPTEQRHVFIEAIREQGFAKNIPLELNIKNQGVLHMLFSVYPVTMGNETFFLSVATDVSDYKPSIKKFHNDIFLKLTAQDSKFIKTKLKQYRLTPRQQEIALLSTTGHSDGEIAKKIFISEYTVKDHMKEIRKVLGVRRRSELFPKLVNMR